MTQITNINYMGWPDAVRLDNGTVEIVVIPSVARVIHFSLRGQPNVLRVDANVAGQTQNPDLDTSGTYKEFGGGKLWVAPQDHWNNRLGVWPPHFALDSGPCRVEKLPSGVVALHGQGDPKSGVQYARTVALNGSSAELTITMTNVSNRPVAWGIWSVACISPESTVFLPRENDAVTWAFVGKRRTPVQSAGWRQFGDTYVFENAPGIEPCKVFNNAAPSWVGAITRGQAFLITFDRTPPTCLPPGEASGEVYACRDFLELEHVGPFEALLPGTRATLHERWHALPAPTASTSQGVAEWMSAKAAEIQQPRRG